MAPPIERKIAELSEFKMVGDADGPGGFEGYAATYDLDSGNDIIVKGAFAKTLPGFLRDGWAARAHDWEDFPLATYEEAREDSRGLYVKAQFHSTPDAQQARTIIRERQERGKSVSLSIGYSIPVGGSALRKDGVRELKQIDLHEVSIVTLPMNRHALLTSVKSADLWSESMSTAEHGEHAIAGVQSYAQRLRSIAASPDVDGTGRKEGRTLSGANRQRLQAVLDALVGLDGIRGDIADLLTATERAAAVEAAAEADEPEGAGKALAAAALPSAELLALRQTFITLDAYYDTVTAR